MRDQKNIDKENESNDESGDENGVITEKIYLENGGREHD